MWDNIAHLVDDAARRASNRPKQKGKSDSDLIAACVDLKEMLTKERGSRSPQYLQDPRLRLAYLAAYLIPNAARVRAILDLERPETARSIRMLDVGAGPLSASLGTALSHLGPRLDEVVAVDSCREIMQDGAGILSKVRPALPVKLLRQSALGKAARLPSGPFDLVLVANLLSELKGRPQERLALGQRLLDTAARSCAPGGLLLVLEPGTRLASRTLMSLRDALHEGPLSILAPCTGARTCPLRGGSAWCHSSRPAELPGPTARLRASAGMGGQKLSYSYLLLRKAAAQPPLAELRLVSDVMTSGRRRLRYACARRGRVTLEWPQDQAVGALEQAHRGDALQPGQAQGFGAKDRPQTRGRKTGKPRRRHRRSKA